MFDGAQSSGGHRIDGSAARDLMIWAVLFDFWMYVLSGAGAALSIIGLLSSTGLGTTGLAVNVIPVIGQIVSVIIAGVGVTSSSGVLLLGIGISSVAAITGTSLSLILNGFFKQRGVNVFGRSIAWRIITVIITKIIPGFGALPLFTIFTALSISDARKEDDRRNKNQEGTNNIFSGEGA